MLGELLVLAVIPAKPIRGTGDTRYTGRGGDLALGTSTRRVYALGGQLSGVGAGRLSSLAGGTRNLGSRATDDK